MTLDQIDPLSRAVLLKLYAEFPTVSVHDLVSIHKNMVQDPVSIYQGVRKYLLRQPSIAARFAEKIGNAQLKLSVKATPSEIRSDSGNATNFELQNVMGQYMYQHKGETWYCEFFAKAKKLPKTN